MINYWLINKAATTENINGDGNLFYKIMIYLEDLESSIYSNAISCTKQALSLVLSNTY